MDRTFFYHSPVGELLLASDGDSLTGLWMKDAKYYGEGLSPGAVQGDLPVFCQAARWLDRYFSGEEPGALPPLAPRGSEFRQKIWQLLLDIPYGCTVTYGELASRLTARWGVPGMSAQAVGGAVGHNPISILIPCHRVVGANGSLTGYAGGIEKKLALLQLEKAELGRLFIPRHSTAP
ncbi:MAG: methylated-DNA--[protein]-cysteine S-methyltransferase [Oscillospiraceae bacterium]|nr:methylated-DNA--[protein]-cysteine S-methyltransferase [Oscillospiraceae bacterium]